MGARDRDNYFSLSRDVQTGGIINGTYDKGLLGKLTWFNVPVGPWFADTVLEFTESENNSAIRAMNVTNPGRPQMLLPVFLYEIKDIPDMLKFAWEALLKLEKFSSYDIRHLERLMPYATLRNAKSYAKYMAAANVGLAFGWEPLIRDLGSIIDTVLGIEKRREEFNRLHSGRGLKRRIRLDEREFKSERASVAIWSRDGTTLTSPVQRVAGVKRWATVRWKPSQYTPSLTDLSDADLRQMMLGVNLNSLPSIIWEATPWSWLADYFTNLGDLVASTNNSCHVICTSCCIMSHRHVTVTAPSKEFFGGAVKLSAYEYRWEQKRRTVGMPIPSPEFGLPFLNGRQLSVLGSLAITRGGPRI